MNAGVTKNEVQNVQKGTKLKNFVFISIIIFILLMLAITAQFVYAVLKYDNIYKGVYINGINAGGYTATELETLLNKNYKDSLNDLEVTLNVKNISEKFSFSDIGVSCNIQEVIDKAYSIGRSGNIIKRLRELLEVRKNGMQVNINITFDREKLAGIIQSLYDKTFIPVKEADLIIEEDSIKLRTGHHGESIDKDYVMSEVEKLVNSFEGGVIDVPLIITNPAKISVDDLYKRIKRDPVNAYPKVVNNKVEIVPHVPGIEIDRSYLESVVAELENIEDIEKELQVSFITPEITTEKANELLFRDVLATKSTYFSTSGTNNANRGENIKLAASKINGKILAPGEVFSFNEVVGKRTAEAGYKTANVYSNGRVIDDIGGGICQVSTTLYNAVLYSDLEVIQRRNHTFTVGYVPSGMDATVSYGSVDFQFRNSTNWPIKIQSRVTDNHVYFTLIGTNETPGKKVEIVTEVVKTTPFTTKYFDDPTLPEGTTKVKQSGKNGCVVNTYKIIKINGEVVSRTKLHTSTYIPLQEEIIRGTKKVENPPQQQQPPQSETDGTDTESSGNMPSGQDQNGNGNGNASPPEETSGETADTDNNN
ncbi:MAG TPA: vanomycin resistance protein VanB [Clostridiaceae bacterium]|nr:vanomycin resistance protein VanB [Clostridiaceae bacterium]